MQNEVNNDNVSINPSPETVSFSQAAPDTTMYSSNDQAQLPKENPLLKYGKAPIIAAIVLLVLLVGGISFKTITSSPKTVFKNSINSLYKGLNNGIDEIEDLSEKFDIKNKALILSGDVKLNASKELLESMEELEDFDFNLNDYSIGADFGIDLKNERLSLTAFLKGKSERLDLNAYYEDGAEYIGSNLFSGLVKTEDVEVDFSEYLDLYETIEENIDLDSENYDYVIKAIKDAILKSLDTKYMEKESDEIKIAGERVKVTKYTYTLNEEAVQEMARSIADILLDDKDFSKKLAKLVGEDKDTIEEGLKEIKKSSKEIEFDEKAVFNVYQKGLLGTAAGFDVRVDKKEYFHCYTDGDNIDVKYDDNGGEDYGTVVEVVSKKKKKDSEVTIKYNGEKVAELTVREISDKLIDLDYTIISDEEIKGTIYLSYNEDKTSIKGDYKFKLSLAGQEASVEGSYGLETKDELDKVDRSKVVSEDDIDEEKLEEEAKENLDKIAEKDSSFKVILDFIAYQEEEVVKSHLNSYGMYNVGTTEIESILKREKPTVLFVGSSYYSPYSDEASYTLFENIQKVQTELDFYSYFYNSYNVNDTFKELVKDVKATCKYKDNSALEPPLETQTPEVSPAAPTEEFINQQCGEYPIVYFIKDGKVVSALKGAATVEDIKTALTEIGIN